MEWGQSNAPLIYYTVYLCIYSLGDSLPVSWAYCFLSFLVCNIALKSAPLEEISLDTCSCMCNVFLYLGPPQSRQTVFDNFQLSITKND